MKRKHIPFYIALSNPDLSDKLKSISIVQLKQCLHRQFIQIDRRLFFQHFIPAALFLFLIISPGTAQQLSTSPHKTFSITCENCHTTDNWTTIKNYSAFNHSLTNFTLIGEHKNVQCKTCHTGNGLTSLSSQCSGCHQDKHHAEFGDACERCHTTEGWRAPIKFVLLHEATRFPLLGAHRQVECKGCHSNQQKNEYVVISVECSQCHRGDFNEAKSPNHLTLSFPLTCERCHDVEKYSWKPARFDHSKFPLEGAHAQLACDACHKGSYEGTSVNCIDCHRNDFNNAISPNHIAGNYPANCALCHTTRGWKPASYNHDLTGFPLTGGHNIQDCFRCHKNNTYSGLSADCVTCHKADYDQTKNPNHLTGNFPTTCKTCHTIYGWSPATFDHSKTKFPLTGGHANRQCIECHKNNQWSGLATDCYSCHAQDYSNAKNPDHVGANFPHDCSTCHTVNSWKPATFDHSKTKFPLTGAHVNRQCTDCHKNNQWSGLATDCYSCHAQDYTNAKNPNHAGANYPRDCTQCHTTSVWKPSTFNHDAPYFPIYSGAHRNKWTRCDECHTNPSNYQSYSCIDCHEHDRAKMDSEHKDVRNYSYISTECYRCHPRGTKE